MPDPLGPMQTATADEQCCGNPACDGVSCKETQPPPPDPITMDEARAAIAGAVMKSLRLSITEAEALTEAAPTETEKKNGEMYVQAGKELYTSLKVMKAKLERPRILQTARRHMKVVRE